MSIIKFSHELNKNINTFINIDLEGHNFISVYITVPTGGTIILEGSRNKLNWDSLSMTSDATSLPTATITTNGGYYLLTNYQFLRFFTSVAGTANGAIIVTICDCSSEINIGSVFSGTIVNTNLTQVNDSSLNVYNLFENSYQSTNKLIHHSNYRSYTQTTDDQNLYFEDTSFNAGENINSSGLRIQFPNSLDKYERFTRFYSANTGNTLYVLSLSGIDITENARLKMEFGLRIINGPSILFTLELSNTGSEYIQIDTVLGTYLGIGSDSRTYAQTDFNIDTIDGTGISELTYLKNWMWQSLFILNTDNHKFIFGLSDNYRNIPVHSINFTDLSGNRAINSLLPKMRPYFSFERLDSETLSAPLTLYVSHLSIYKDKEYSSYNFQSLDNSANIVSATETLLVALRYPGTSYRGNIQLKNLYFYSNRIMRLKIYYGANTAITLGGSPVWLTTSNLQHTITDVTFSGGIKIYSALTNTEVNKINLEPIINYKHFNYNFEQDTASIILFTIENLETTTAAMEFDLSWCEF